MRVSVTLRKLNVKRDDHQRCGDQDTMHRHPHLEYLLSQPRPIGGRTSQAPSHQIVEPAACLSEFLQVRWSPLAQDIVEDSETVKAVSGGVGYRKCKVPCACSRGVRGWHGERCSRARSRSSLSPHTQMTNAAMFLQAHALSHFQAARARWRRCRGFCDLTFNAVPVWVPVLRLC